MSKILIALGGNALGNTPSEQLQLVKEAAKPIVDLIEQGHDVIIAHGNGPQVGAINLAFEIASKQNPNIPEMPFPECGAMSQGYIGYHLQNGIRKELRERYMKKPVATIVTHVVVDSNDPAFQNPTKPIGGFYTKEEAEKLMAESNDKYIEDSGRGYRKVIPSPKPLKVIEKETIESLVNTGQVVITVGGGGIPVIEKGNDLIGVEAVIDKDLASECLAEEIDADFLFILTAVEKIAINFGKPNQVDLKSLSVEEAKSLIDEGQFPPGSMLPKVEAAIKFVESKPGRKAIISSLEKAKEAVLGETGTVIYNKVKTFSA
ncbi:carbamate kinase [Calidifontibacillus oryziterrae]|uniref:carbamate kinase n=1 Tax=Calidifontibacillus oryziterrae TaxID=1191699 RepID=UPI0002DBD12D|nr:carbamate kinase [Calidifontibacillus oryziterrae]